jgi:hypothetical protein
MLAGARQQVRTLRRRTVTARTIAALTLAALMGRMPRLWIGDSHTMFFAGSPSRYPLYRAGCGDFVWHIGPRLMYSLAREGFPRAVGRLARWLRWTRLGSRVVLIFVAGEIDVRCHMAAAPDRIRSAEFAGRYLEATSALAGRAGTSRFVVTVPVPPSDDYHDNPGFPIRGTLAQRLAAHAALREALHAARSSDESLDLRLVDATPQLARADRGLRAEFTFDGCHVNPDGAAIVRRLVDQAVAGTMSD